MYEPGVQNTIADALSKRPQVHNVTIAYHQDLQYMQSQYAEGPDFGETFQQMLKGQSSGQYSIKGGYLMKDCLCIIQGLRQKIMEECHAPPYARHRGIASTTQALERYFFSP